MQGDNETVAENCSGRQDTETTFDDAIAAIGKNVNTSFQNCPTKDLDVVIMPIGGVWADIKAVEAAHRREVAELQRRLKVAEDALTLCIAGMCGECHRQNREGTCVCPNGCYEMTVAKNALAAIREKGGAK